MVHDTGFQIKKGRTRRIWLQWGPNKEKEVGCMAVDMKSVSSSNFQLQKPIR